jgi:transglutaminase-like putative cysteine protease
VTGPILAERPPATAAVAPPPSDAPGRPPPADAPVLPVLPARVAATAALGAFAGLGWAAQLSPSGGLEMIGMLAAALVGGLALQLANGLEPAPRVAASAAAIFAVVLAALLIAGIPLRLLEPSSWGEFVTGVDGALTALPGVRVPYPGLNEWIRWTILAGGTLLLAVGVLAALWPGGRTASRALAVGALAVLYAVPAVEANPSAPFLRGFAFGLLLAAFLLLERVRVRSVAPAAALTGAALLAGVLAAAALDRSRPPIDYEAIAASLQQRGDPTFEWQPTYGPITWTRDGREVLRVRARQSAYWKAENLDGFDGTRWTRTRLLGRVAGDAEVPTVARERPEWFQTIRVRVTGMRSSEIVGAGTTLAVTRPGQPLLPAGSPGTWVVGRELQRGDAYRAVVYVPNPSAQQLEQAGTVYPDALSPYRTLDIPAPGGGPSAPDISVTYSDFGSPRPPLALLPTGLADRSGGRITEASVYGRSYELARRLAAGAGTPYAFVRRVEAHFAKGYRYTETPPVRRVPLESFLFTDRAGYCQQFSGAMALLLRMGGVPARVATGFAPGTLDRRRGEYVVRDLDAHSWVEAWFPDFGWVPFDPTPSAAPAATQAVQTLPSAASPGGGDRPQSGPAAPSRSSGGDDGGSSRGWLVALAAALVAAIVLGALLLARLGSRTPRGEDPLLAELEVALHRTGRPAPPGTTLRTLEQRFAGSPDAVGYLRALREARYGHGAGGPTASQRTGLRRELARGLGPAGRLRALWALPPRASRSVRSRP